MCTCPAALNKAAAALHGVNCVIKEGRGGGVRNNPAPGLCHVTVEGGLERIFFKKVSKSDMIWTEIAKQARMYGIKLAPIR